MKITRDNNLQEFVECLQKRKRGLPHSLKFPGAPMHTLDGCSSSSPAGRQHVKPLSSLNKQWQPVALSSLLCVCVCVCLSSTQCAHPSPVCWAQLAQTPSRCMKSPRPVRDHLVIQPVKMRAERSLTLEGTCVLMCCSDLRNPETLYTSYKCPKWAMWGTRLPNNQLPHEVQTSRIQLDTSFHIWWRYIRPVSLLPHWLFRPTLPVI